MGRGVEQWSCGSFGHENETWVTGSRRLDRNRFRASR